ncbi:hypothetical protein RHMOL_Rhmol04G0351600 [Rhododendron molle]|uniref:Uncharacterized protein n=1 Tax=Rhododendron molle TaxID=49168 RepID=A0ACC0P8P9_RHOML|nr:hypothetical protein RHMOL_Rhmol04G0351600 [Rhododendron molle]
MHLSSAKVVVRRKSFSIEMGSEGNTNSSGDILIDMYSRVKLKASDGRVCGSGRDNSALKNVKLMNVQGKKIMANNDVNSRGISNKKECLDFTVKCKALVLGGNNSFPSRVTKKARLTNLAKQEAVISSRNIKGNRERRDGQGNLNDEGTALKRLDALKQGRLAYLGYRHEVGDMVWGRVESHPWWSGQIFDEAFACQSINTRGFLTAFGEAKDEVNKRAALGLTCFCQNPNNFRTAHVQGFLEMDVSGFENGRVYPVKQIERARDGFQPIKSLSFLQKLALMPRSAPLSVQRVIKKTIAFKNVRDYSSSSSKPPKKMPSSGEKPIKKLNEMKPSTGGKKATKPLEVQACQPQKKSTIDENGSIDSITKTVNAINKKYCQVEERKNESKQSTSSTTNDVDISRPMLILMRKCSYIVADLMNSSASSAYGATHCDLIAAAGLDICK